MIDPKKFKRMSLKMYSGRRDKTGVCVVHVIHPSGESCLLPPRLDLFNHSPTGFEWGYGGSGPAQLALAILADVLGPGHEETAVRMHQQYKFAVIGCLKRKEPWTINEKDVLNFLVDHLTTKKESNHGKFE